MPVNLDHTVSDPASAPPSTDALLDAPAPLQVPVRVLCHFTARGGDLDRRFTPSLTGVEGIAGHQVVTARRGAGYQREVALSARFGPLVVQGRADGFDPAAGRVEEIKTRRGDATRVPANQQALHRAQARVYGWMLCQQLGLAQIEVALVYYDIDSGQETVQSESIGATALQAFFEALCARYLAWALAEQAHRSARDAALSGLGFPFDTFRAGQRDLAAQVYRAHTRGRHLMAQAPTGIGKTMATVFAGLRAMPGTATDRLLFLTARTTGRQLALDALSRLGAGSSLPLRVLERTARSTACEHPDKACHGESCPLARGFYDRLPAARQAASDRLWLDRDSLREIALAHDICPYYLGQEMQRWSDVLVGDINHWFDLGAHWWALTQEQGWRVALLVDEAHNLTERARSLYSASLDAHGFLRLRQTADPPVRRALDRLHRRWSELARTLEVPPEGSAALEGGLPADWCETLQHSCAEITEHLAQRPEAASDAPLLDWVFGAQHLLRLAQDFGDHSLCEAGPWAAPPRGRALPSLRIRNVLPAPWLEDRWAGAHSATLFSATLTPMDAAVRLLGLPDETTRCELPSPFSPDQLAVRVAPWISTRFRDRAASLEPLVRVIADQYEAQPGNYLAFFSSFDYLDQALERLARTHPGIPHWVQTRGMAEPERDAFVARFVAGGQGIGFAVLGGAFGEGIDLPGSRLVGAFIATLGLPQVNAENERMRQRLQALTGTGYEHTYLFPGLTRVVQAAGRVIRSEQDRGVVWLLDDRFARAEVRRLLPAWWRITVAPRP